MATLKEIEDAIRAADAAGDAEAVQALAVEYERLSQAAPAPTPAPAPPGGRLPASPGPAPGGVATTIPAPTPGGLPAAPEAVPGGLPSFAPPAPVERYDPTEGMSPAGKILAGMGQATSSTIRGGRQLFNYLTGDQAELARLNEEENEARRLDAPLLSTGWGRAGQIAGHVAQAAIPGTAVARGVRAAGGGTKALIAAEAALGGATGALQPTVQGESRAANAKTGAIIGGAIPAASAAWQGLKQMPASVLAHAIRMASPKGAGPIIDIAARQIKSGSSKVREEAGRKMGELVADVRVPLSRELASKLRAVRHQYADSLPPDVTRTIDEWVGLAKSGRASLKGPAIQEARTAMNREAAKTSSGLARTGLQRAQRTLDQALSAQLPRSKAAQLRALRDQYKTGVKPGRVNPEGLYRGVARGTAQSTVTGAKPPQERKK